MNFYTVNGSPNCRKVHAVINYLGLDVNIVEMDIFSGELAAPEFMALNPNGKVPVLEDGDFRLWESNAIMQYLAATAPDNSLYPDDPRVRADIHRWQDWEQCHFNRACGGFLFENILKSLFKIGEPDPVALKESEDNFITFAKILEQQLEGRDFILGENVTLADFSAGSMMIYAATAGIPLAPFKNITAWSNRLEGISAWAEVPALAA
jgi:glutathione S-transferase